MKKLVFLSIIGYAGYWLYDKYISTKEALSSLKIELSKIHGVKINLKKLRLLVDLQLKNLSNFNLSLSTFSTVKIKQLQFQNRLNNQVIGIADVDISRIVIGARDSIIIKDIEANVQLSKILTNLSLFLGKNQGNLNVIVVLESFGKHYVINPDAE